jgi:hypothetical protein
MAKDIMESTYREQVLRAFKAGHSGGIKNETLTLSSRVEGTTVVTMLELATVSRKAVHVMEAAVDTEDKRISSQIEALDVTVDFLDWYLGVFFRDERDTLLPLDWQPHQFGEFEVLARGDFKNEKLDGLADAWLRGEGPEVQE